MAKLVLLSEGLTGKSCELKVDKTTIGRLEDNTFHIPEPSVSSHHCEVLVRGADIFVKDLSSTNGTFINGEQVSTESPLKPGQILRLGQVEMRLETGDALSAAATGKKKLDQTRVIPQGVKLNELEQQGTRPMFEKNSPFVKKSNKTAMIFITIGAILFVVILVSLFIAIQKMR
ncbi:MAG: FHA domain-containing protein [Pedosphaera sp.]|nr:FHA domain-containing protein [Pedosphaera sp.]